MHYQQLEHNESKSVNHQHHLLLVFLLQYTMEEEEYLPYHPMMQVPIRVLVLHNKAYSLQTSVQQFLAKLLVLNQLPFFLK